MVASPTSSTSSVSSISSISFSDCPPKTPSIKLLCSYGGCILPRLPDGRLRYVGGVTRVLSVPRSVSFSDLMERLGDLFCVGGRVSLRCKIPTEDLDALVSITSDEDIANLVEEYEIANRDRSSSWKIRAFLFPSSPALTRSKKPPSPTASESRSHSSPPLTRHIHPSPYLVCSGSAAPSQFARPSLVRSGGHW